MKKKLFFKNSQGLKLCGILSNPTSQKDKLIVILCHGFLRSKEGRTYISLEEILNQAGISTFRFDFFGHGQSEGKFEEITSSEAVDDVLKAIKFIKELGYQKIGLFGSSFGGLASIMAAAQRDDLHLLALKSPVVDYLSLMQRPDNVEEIKKWQQRGFSWITTPDGQKLKLNFSFFEDAKKINGFEAAQKIKAPTLIVHGDADITVPVEQSRKTSELIPNCRLEIIKGAYHAYSQPEHFKQMLEVMADFIINRSKEKLS